MDADLLNRGRTAFAAVALLAVAVSALVACTTAAPGAGGMSADPPAQESQAAEDTTPAAGQSPVPPVVREWAPAWNGGSPEQMAELFTDDGTYEDHAFQAVFQGKDGVAQWVSITTESIEETHVEIAEVFRSGDKIAVQWTFSGRNSAGGLADLPPTGKSFSVPAVSLFEMEGNEIRSVDDYYNLADLLRHRPLAGRMDTARGSVARCADP